MQKLQINLNPKLLKVRFDFLENLKMKAHPS
jgi:hypothetical protein